MTEAVMACRLKCIKEVVETIRCRRLLKRDNLK